MEELYTSLLEKYNDIETYSTWEKDTEEANKITLIHNGTQAGRKTPQVLQAIQYLSENADYVIVQTPYVICNGYMYTVLHEIADHAKLQIILNAVEKGSNPWGCTDYLNQKRKILKTGADVYELMNDYPVHTKTVLIDNRLSVVGSYNLDMRSTYLDTELMLAVYSEGLNAQLAANMDSLWSQSVQYQSGAYLADAPVASFWKMAAITLLSPFVSLLRYLV